MPSAASSGSGARAGLGLRFVDLRATRCAARRGTSLGSAVLHAGRGSPPGRGRLDHGPV